jgi:predicted DNA-binding protein
LHRVLVFDIEVFVENVRQDPNSAYTLSGTTLTFTGAPASGTNNIYVVHQAKAVGTIEVPASNSGDTTFNGTITMNGGVVLNEESADVDFRVESNGNANMIKVDGGNDRVGIGTSSPSQTLHVEGNLLVDAYNNAGEGGGIFLRQGYETTAQPSITVKDHSGSAPDGISVNGSDGVSFRTADTERMRIDSSGDVIIGKTSSSFSTKGFFFNVDPGQADFVGEQANPIRINRLTDDGDLISLQQAGSQEGTISVSGGTVSYNGFTGTHWSRLTDNSKPTILKGTILESLDEMCDWYQAVADVAEIKDSEGNVTTAAHQVKEYINLGSKSVGDSITFTSNGVEYTGKIEKEDDVKHAKTKVSDTEASKAVYGLFVNWDEDDTTYNDMLLAQTGTYIIRIHKDETVAKGDLIQSKGDGTGKVQADDIMRSSTVAKVLSTTKIETYSDGSYIVPCSLHC